MKLFPFVLLLTISVCGISGSCLADQIQNTNKTVTQLLSSTNGAARLRLAEKLSGDHKRATFETLLKLLRDESVDVSYAAAESIEVRKDKEFDDLLIDAMRRLPRDNRWPSYRAAANYGTERMLKFLKQSLKAEIRFQRRRKNFDSENCFYISHSITRIVNGANSTAHFAAPDGTSLAENEGFLKSIQSGVKE